MPSNMAINRIITFPRSYMQLYFSGFNNTSYMCVGESRGQSSLLEVRLLKVLFE